MMFQSAEVLVGGEPLKRRILKFDLIDANMVLESDCDQERETTRHKFRTVRFWSRLNRRDSTMQRRSIPQEAIENALQQMRKQIQYRD